MAVKDFIVKNGLQTPVLNVTTTAVLPANTSIGTVTSTHLGYLNTLSSNVQTQLNAKQPLDATLTAMAGVATAADKLIYFNGVDTATSATLTSFARGLIGNTDASTARNTLGVTIGTNVQAWDADLDAIAALAGTSGFLKKTAANTWSLDTNTYLTGNQTITVTGDVDGSGTTAITLTLDTVNSNVGSFGSATQAGTFTVNGKGLVTAASNVTITPAWSSITSKPTTLSGYGITDALSNSSSSTQAGYFGDIYLQDDSTPSHYLQITNSANLTLARILSINVNDADRTVSLSGNLTVSSAATVSGTNTGDQTITLSGGDVTTSAMTSGSYAATLVASGVVAGTYNNVATEVKPFTVDSKGRITGVGAAVTITPAWGSVTGKPTTISGYGFTDVSSSNTANYVVQRDASGNFSAGTITAVALTLSGDLTVNGTTTTINSTTLSVDDKNIELGSVAVPTDVTADGGGITLKGATDKTFNWVDATDAWTSSEHLNLLTGKAYYINAASVLNSTTLGTGVVNSSLTKLGLTSAGFVKTDASGNLSVDANTYSTTAHTHNYAGSASAGGAANSVANSLIIKLDSGTTEGTDQYTFNGSAAKTIDFKAGTNVTLTDVAGAVTINVANTNWDNAYIDRYKWDGSILANGGTQTTARTSIGATTVGSSFITLANPGTGGTIRFIKITDNVAAARTAAEMLSDIGAMAANNTTIGNVTLAAGGAATLTLNGTVTLNQLTPYGVVVAGATAPVYTSTAAGTTGQVLQANTSAAPTWTSSLSGFTLTNPVINGTVSGTASLATQAYADSAVSTHNADTTGVHGIADTSAVAGILTEWTDYAPSFTNATGVTGVFRYKLNGKTLYLRGFVTDGTATTSAAVTASLPLSLTTKNDGSRQVVFAMADVKWIAPGASAITIMQGLTGSMGGTVQPWFATLEVA